MNTPKVVSFADLDPSVFEYESGSFVVITSCASTPTYENMETPSSDDEVQLAENQHSVVENVKPMLESMTVDAQNV